MIAYLAGRVHEKAPSAVVVVVGGVGYKVLIPVSTYYELPAEGGDVTLRVHTHVREDALSLYGFATTTEEYLFDRLIGVAGVGPALALKIMSGLEPDALVDAIRGGDLRRLNGIPGVGKKTAERLVVELRDKMPEMAATTSAAAGEAPSRTQTLVDDLLSALSNLGFARPQSEKEVQALVRESPELSFEDGLKQVLRKLSR